MSWIVWLILAIILLPGFCYGIMLTPFAFDDPYENTFMQYLMAALIPLWMSVLVPILAVISLIFWIFRVH